MNKSDIAIRFITWLFVAIIAGYAGGCAVNDSAVKTQADQTNQGLAPAIEQDQGLNGYLQTLGKRIMAAAKKLDEQHVGPDTHFKGDNNWMWTDNIQFHLVNSKTLNAFTTGGDHVYIYNELFQKCNSEDELAAVMSHEFGHIYCRHVQKGMQRQEWITAGTAAVGGAGYVAGGEKEGSSYASAASGAATVAANFIGMGFTRGDEDQADDVGFHIYCLAGWDPAQFANFFKTMISLGYDTTPTFMSDHPMLKDRVTATNNRLAQFNKQFPTDPFRVPDIASGQQFAQYKQTAQAIAARTPNDQQLAKAQQLLNAFPSCVARTESQDQITAKQQILQETGRTQAQPATPAGK